MNHARLLMVSAIASALAACGGGGGDSASNATSTSSADSSASATSNVTVNIDGLTMPAARQAVEQANESAAVAKRQAEEAQARLLVERQREDAAAREQQIAAAQAEAQRLQEDAKVEADKLAQAQAALVAIAQRDAQQQPTVTQSQEIPDCSRNAAAVDDPETGLKLVCESQITVGATTADVGTRKHASGRYYALPFPDKSMMFVGKMATYKMGCSDTVCEWLRYSGSMGYEYAAQGKDGNYYRFTECRNGQADSLICAYPSTGRPDGIDVDDRQPEKPRIGRAITDTDTSGKRGFRPRAATSAPVGCDYGRRIPQGYGMGLTDVVFPWPERSLFRQLGEQWVAVFDGGNCLGDVRVTTADPDSPGGAWYWASATSWVFQVAGPDGRLMEPLREFPRLTSYDQARAFQEAYKNDHTVYYQSILYQAVSEGGTAGSSASGGSAGNAASAADAAEASANGGLTQSTTPPAKPGTTDTAAPGNTTPADGAAAPQENQNAQPTPDVRTTEGGGATAGAANGATQGPVTSAGMFQQQQNEGAAVPGTRSESGGAFPWNGNGSTVSYEGRQITTTVQPDGSITYRTSAGAVPFDRATDANGNVLTEVVGCTEQEGDGPQECTFRAAA